MESMIARPERKIFSSVDYILKPGGCQSGMAANHGYFCEEEKCGMCPGSGKIGGRNYRRKGELLC
jgi:hypothetical protein